MLGALRARVLVTVILMATWSCARLPGRAQAGRPGTVAIAVLPDSISVPAAWGNLVSVTVNPAFTNVELLWFQDAQGTIHKVVFDVDAQRLHHTATLIPRR
jgi:hypothetical protein